MKTTLDEMLTFIAVVDSGSITAASERLGQTISATSRILGRLEEKLQTTLLHRTTRRLKLSEEGEVYLEQAREIVARVEETEEMLSLRRNHPAGRLRVDAATPFMLHVIVPLVSGYCQRYPQVELELNSNEGITDLLEKRTDVAIRIGRLKDSTLHATPVGSSRIRVLASPGYLSARGVPAGLSELKQHTLLGFTEPASLNDWPLNDDDGQPLHIEPAIRSSSGETLRQLALRDAGIVCLSDFMTHEDRRLKRLQPLFEEQILDIRQPINAVYYRNTVLSSRIRSFIDYIRDQLSQAGFNDKS